MADGVTIETAMTGRDSVLNGASVLNGTVPICIAIVQIEGNASLLVQAISEDCCCKQRIAVTSCTA
jgi:hypothetical protein